VVSPDVQQTAQTSSEGNSKVDQEYNISDRLESEPNEYHHLLDQYNTQITWPGGTPASEPREASLYHGKCHLGTIQLPDTTKVKHYMMGSTTVALLDYPRHVYAFRTKEGGLRVQKLEDPYFSATVGRDQTITYIVGKFTRPVNALYVDEPVTATFMEAEGNFGLISPPPDSVNE